MKLQRLDHIAYATRDLREGIATVQVTSGLAVATEFELPEFSLRGAMLGESPIIVEVVEFQSPEIAESRLGGLAMRLDHVAYEVDDIDEVTARLRALGIRISGPDGVEVDRPIDLGGARHVWTMPADSPLCLQLVERPTEPTKEPR
jgi:catechol 2,3-dioxygenase-like lactoylglutathione lyase family enzyme